MTYWYISFATDEGFRGATVVEGCSPAHAVAVATMKGLNPGGEAAVLEIPPGYENEPDLRILIDRLVGRVEMEAHGAKRSVDLPQYMRDRFEAEATVVCEEYNK